MKYFLLLVCAVLYAQNDKTYLDPSQISVESDQILVVIEGEWYPTSALYVDMGGVYVLSAKWYVPWWCDYCRALNPPHRLMCWKCGK